MKAKNVSMMVRPTMSNPIGTMAPQDLCFALQTTKIQVTCRQTYLQLKVFIYCFLMNSFIKLNQFILFIGANDDLQIENFNKLTSTARQAYLARMKRLAECVPGREIRAGTRRIRNHQSGFTIKSSSSEQLSRFLQDSSRTKLRLSVSRGSDRHKIVHLVRFRLNIRLVLSILKFLLSFRRQIYIAYHWSAKILTCWCCRKQAEQ